MPIAPDNLDLQVPIGADSSRYKVSDRRLSVSIGTYRELSARKTDFQVRGPVVRPVVRGPAAYLASLMQSLLQTGTRPPADHLSAMKEEVCPRRSPELHSAKASPGSSGSPAASSKKNAATAISSIFHLLSANFHYLSIGF